MRRACPAVPIIFVVGQTIADYVLSPYLVGRRVNLHPRKEGDALIHVFLLVFV